MVAFMPASNKSQFCFSIRGNGKSLVMIRIGPDKNSGACCTGVSKESTNGVCGEIGYKIYDDGTKRQLGVITSDIKGKMIDLRNYY
jgi:hypothetical protein